MCGCLKIFNTSFKSYHGWSSSYIDYDLSGKEIVSRKGIHGVVLETIANNSGKAVGYIVKQGSGNRISVLRSDVLQII